MQHYTSLQDVQLNNAWLTIGSFDGVHLGHQKILEPLTAGAAQAGTPAVALTFYPHPSLVLRGPQSGYYLTTPEERARLLGEAGVDIVITHPFSVEVARIPAEDFLRSLKAHLGFTQLWVGYDFALGRHREGDIATLEKLSRELDYQLHQIPPYELDSVLVSSTRIRELLGKGDVQAAEALLGHQYSLGGIVLKGDGRGRTIGIPTANLSLAIEYAIPKKGVYVTQAQINGEVYPAITNVGVRPTFDAQREQPLVETHILDFDGDIYGKEMSLAFLARLRDEQRFDGVDALVAQINQDIEQAREYFESV
ncbi:MAG: bifunctional riboflavin kinase/FAD synthetase [Chloroflexi bacterium]|nr:MAG: bifunctional riboflavin kinase/FAD synthetase [Chloroflexota bacterium]MBL1196630.1 bifunctional riboflavin kinase/FAD synthetase [Chloroflexota bacterium]NOH13923.1 bifunctional riboflavin kinase/FAD synthetase [Chloroflexota bacterium]